MDPLAREIYEQLQYFSSLSIEEVLEATGRDIQSLSFRFGQVADGVFFDFPWVGSYRAPAMAYEQRTGLTGAAGYYVFPEGLEAQDLESYVSALMYLSQNREDIASEKKRVHPLIWMALKDINPELKKIVIDENDAVQVSDAIMGVTSGFNPHDIDSFINIGVGSVQECNPHYQALRQHVEEKTVPMYWVPSYHTMAMIAHQLKQRERNSGPSP